MFFSKPPSYNLDQLMEGNDKPPYTIGNNKNGDVVLTINGETVSTWLTMSTGSVKHLIKMLEVAASITTEITTENK